MPRGLTPIRHLTGGTTFRQKLYPAITSGAVYIGDPVAVSAGVAKPLNAAASGATVLGVVAHVLDSNKKPLTFSQPARGPFKPAGSSGYYLSVYDDPEIVYQVSCDTNAGNPSNALIGAAVKLTAATANSAAGTSGYLVRATAATVADSAFRVIGLSPTDLDGVYTSGAALEIVAYRSTFQVQS